MNALFRLAKTVQRLFCSRSEKGKKKLMISNINQSHFIVMITS